MNDSSDKISTCRTNLKREKVQKILNSNNDDNQDEESINSLKVNKIIHHKYMKSNKI